ncbi:MAG: accessory factor UbiK family protein [Gammaproteobacteria bacterium]
MSKRNLLDEITQKLCDALPPNLQVLKKDMEKNFHAVLQATFSKMDLVTRDEFDAQTKVLARSRKRIEALEAKLTELEGSLKKKTREKK